MVYKLGRTVKMKITLLPIAVNKNNTPDAILDFIVNVATKASIANTKKYNKTYFKSYI